LLYSILKTPARIALPFYCRHLHVSHPEVLKMKGPLLIACNHPNTFMDAIILATIFKKPIYSLARGDAFKNDFSIKLLKSLNILPVYRQSDDPSKLHVNYDTFAQCRSIFKKNGIVLMFSEGLSINEWKLRSLKKGTARLAFSSWEEGINLTVLPVGINYSSFDSIGKNIHVNFGNAFTWKELHHEPANGHSLLAFTDRLKMEMSALVYVIDSNDQDTLRQTFHHEQNNKLKNGLWLPAFLGKYLHAPLYLPLQKLLSKKYKHTGFYDSLIVASLLLLYPLYLLMIAMVIWLSIGFIYAAIPFVLFPLLAWCYIRTKDPLGKK
jgi:1-acyl-sn-glycerol-3-phosphate acyltransferase